MNELDFIDRQALTEYVRGQRWYGSRSREAMRSEILDALRIGDSLPELYCTLVEIVFGDGTRETYQLLLGVAAASDDEHEPIASDGGRVAFAALSDPLLARELVRAMRNETVLTSDDGARVEFRSVSGASGSEAPLEQVRPLGADQSNTSVVFDERLLLKCYRRLEAGINPELEMLRYLTERGFEHIAPVSGWYAYAGPQIDASLGIVQRFFPQARDGWLLALDALARDAEGFLRRIRRLGEVSGAMHAALASEADDPAFYPETPGSEALGLMTATIDEEIERVFSQLPEDEPALAPIRGRQDDVREALRERASLGSIGRTIRNHGDYHLGQALWTGDDWIVVDFEGEPARSITDRRRKRSPLRDVAGMTRSFAYAEGVARTLHGVDVPEGWEEAAREEFLAGYLPLVEPVGLLPSGHDGVLRLLALFELEKAVYELRYELDHRPELLHIPVEGIMRMLGAPA